MNFDLQKLYDLLPVLYRIRDSELAGQLPNGEEAYGPLKAYLSVISEQVEVLEENLDQLYDDHFIETCSEWAVSYIGSLVGARGLLSFPDAPFSERSQVANTIAYRRRKGTAAVIEQLARDVTGWNANVVEFFLHLATTQYLNHLRPKNLSISDLRDWQRLEYVGTPFDEMAHTVDVRRIEPLRGKYNIHNIGVFVWRIGSYQLTDSAAYRVDNHRYTFDSLGRSLPLYNLPQTETEITHLAEPRNVPMPITRRALADNPGAWYGRDGNMDTGRETDKSIMLFADGLPLLPSEGAKLSDIISSCNLSDDPLSPGDWLHLPAEKIAIDPLLGRITLPPRPPGSLSMGSQNNLPSTWPPRELRVSYCYGFTANMGGGAYDRSATIIRSADKFVTRNGNLSIQQTLDDLVAELTDLQDVSSLETHAHGIVEIQDNGYFLGNIVIRPGKNQTIELRAKDNMRPVLVINDGELRIEGRENSKVILNGILVSGGQIIVPEKTNNKMNNLLGELEIQHCTLLPGISPEFGVLASEKDIMPRLIAELPGLSISIEKCITGGIRTHERVQISISDSIVDALGPTQVAFSALDSEESGGTLQVLNSTIIGKVHAHTIKMASNTIFMAEKAAIGDTWLAPVLAKRLQKGCTRFSWLPNGARVPRPYRCQPAMAAEQAEEAAEVEALSKRATPAEVAAAKAIARASALARVRPQFTSLEHGNAGYCQLHRHCSNEIATGADNESEMGAFHHLYQPQRVTNLRIRLEEYLRFGLEAGIFLAS